MTRDDFAIGVRLHCLSEGTVAMARRALLLGERPPPQKILADAPSFAASGLAVCILLGWWPTPDGWKDAFADEHIEVVGLPDTTPRRGKRWNEPVMALSLMQAFGAPHADPQDMNLDALLAFRDELPV